MAKWKNGYKTVANIGLFAGTDFQPGTIQPQWNFVHSDRTGMSRRWVLEATYGGDYIGGVPASGIEIDYDDLYNMLTGTSQELFALRFGTEATSEYLVVYGRRGNESSWWPAGGCTIFHVTFEMYARLYSDPNTYSQNLVGYADCDVFKPLTGGISASHSHLEFFRYNNSWIVGLSNFATGGGNLYSSYFLWNPVESDFVTQFGQNEPEKTKPKSDEFGPASEPGGGYVPGGGFTPGGETPKIPSFDNTSDKIEISDKPYMNPFRTGFINGYYVTPTQLAHFSDAIFPPPPQSGSDIPNMIWNISSMLFNNKRVDYILDFLIVPVTPGYLVNAENITCGGQPLLWQHDGVYHFVEGNRIEDSMVDFSCGSISIDEYWVNFLDFSGTRVKLFLPYVGYVDIQPEYVIGGTLYVDYRFNVFDGSFMAFVRSDSGYSELEESLIAQFAGVAAMHIPLQSQDYSNKISGLISAVGTVAAAGIGGISAAGAVGAGANLGNTLIQKPGSTHANGYNASSSYLSHRKPYLIIERQWSQFSEKYPEEVGMPSNVMCRLGDLYGLVKSENAHLDVIPASVEGKEKISQLLSEGIIL